MILSVFSANIAQLIEIGKLTTLREVFAYAKHIGIEMVDVFYGEFSDNVENYKSLLKEQGLKMNSIMDWSTIDSEDDDVFYEGILKAKEMIDTAVIMDAQYIMLVPKAENIITEQDRTYAIERMIEGLKKIVSYAKEKNITVTIENFSDFKHPFSTIEEVRYILENVPGLSYTFDSGNFTCVGNDMLEAYEELKHYIVNVHLKDWIYDLNGFIDDTDGQVINGSAIGHGFVKIKELLHKLKQDNYQGAIVIEYNSNNAIKNEIEQSVDFLRSEKVV